MGIREHKIEIFIKGKIESLGGVVRKWTSPGCSGVPDLIIAHNGCVVFAEVKSSDGVKSLKQKLESGRLKKAGAKVCTVYGYMGATKLIKDILSNTDLKQEYR